MQASSYGSTAKSGSNVWRAERSRPFHRVSTIYLNGVVIGTFGVGNVLSPLTASHKIVLNSGEQLIFRQDFYDTVSTLQRGEAVIAKLYNRTDVAELLEEDTFSERAILLAFLMKYVQLDNRLSLGAFYGLIRFYYLLSRPDPN